MIVRPDPRPRGAGTFCLFHSLFLMMNLGGHGSTDAFDLPQKVLSCYPLKGNAPRHTDCLCRGLRTMAILFTYDRYGERNMTEVVFTIHC